MKLLVGILIHFRTGSCRIISIASCSSLANGSKDAEAGTVLRQANAIRAEYTITRATFSRGCIEEGVATRQEMRPLLTTG